MKHEAAKAQDSVTKDEPKERTVTTVRFQTSKDTVMREEGRRGQRRRRFGKSLGDKEALILSRPAGKPTRRLWVRGAARSGSRVGLEKRKGDDASCGYRIKIC